MSLRRLVTRTIGHATSKSMRLISPAAELWIRALNDEGEFRRKFRTRGFSPINPPPSSFLTRAVSTFVTYFVPDVSLRSSLAVRRRAGDFIVPTKDSYVVDRSRLEIAGEGNKGVATKGGGGAHETSGDGDARPLTRRRGLSGEADGVRGRRDAQGVHIGGVRSLPSDRRWIGAAGCG